MLKLPGMIRFYGLCCFLFSLSLSFPAIVLAQAPGNAVMINDATTWCSGDAAYSTENFSKPQPNAPCHPANAFGKWFTFKATSSTIEARLEMGGKKGTLQYPYLSLFDDDLKPVACKPHDDRQATMALIYKGLERGKTYHLCVGAVSKEKNSGSFTLCVQNRVSYDFREGAHELTETAHWCSAPDAFTTAGATPDNKPGSCLRSEMANYNRWFKFKARAAKIDIRITLNKNGAKFPYVTLWTESGRELRCTEDEMEQKELSLSARTLKPGQWYYISVDHRYNPNYPGTFGLCIDDGEPPSEETVVIMGRIRLPSGDGVSKSKVLLLNQKWESIDSLPTDVLGKFSFKELPQANDYLVKVEEQDPNVHVDLYQTKKDGTILKKGVEVQKGIFGFQNLPKQLSFMPLLQWGDLLKLRGPEGKGGIVGRVVSRREPVDGLSDLKVYLYDSPKDVVDSTITDVFGKFWFDQRDQMESMLVQVEGNPKEVYSEMLLVNADGIPKMASTSNNMDNMGFFHFEKLPPMEVELSVLPEVDDPGLATQTDFSELKAGETLQLNEVYFELNEHTLLPESHRELNRLAAALKTNTKARIEISGHTDTTGDEKRNLELSRLRAKAVRDYLVSKGIVSSRLSFLGMGSKNPVATNDTEAGRQSNRRVEFKVLP